MADTMLKSLKQAKRLIVAVVGFTILGGLTFLAIPCALMLSGTAFIVILIGLGFLVAEVAWKKVLWIRVKLSKPKRGGQLW
jgi:hypothetical protein